MKLKPLVSLLVAAFAAPAVLASAQGLVISQVYGGGGNTGAPLKNDFIEIFNGGATAVSVSGWSVQYASSAGTTWAMTALPNVVVQPGAYLLVQQAAGAGAASPLPTPDATGNIAMSATSGKVALVASTTALTGSNPSGGALVDLVGFGAANGSETSPTPTLSNTTAALRKTNGCVDTDNNSADFEVGAPAPRNSATSPNVCGGGVPINAPIVPSCPDASVSAGAAGSVDVMASDIDSIVNSAAIQGSWAAGFSLGMFTAAAADGGSATQRVLVGAGVAPGSYTLNLQWANNEAQTASCSFKVTVAGLTPIYTIQGSGPTSPLVNQTVSTKGIVTRLMSNGFYMQDRLGDGDPATSDGIFVLTTTAPTVAVGQEVSLSGKVVEFVTSASSPDAVANPITELTNPTGINVLSSGNAITPVEVDLATLPAGGLEAYEGMLVTLRGPIMVQQNYFLGRYGQLTISAGGRLLEPTNIMRPGVAAKALEADNLRRTMILDDGSSAQNPDPTPYLGEGNTVRAGDTAESITGVVDFGLATSTASGAAMYRLQPVGPVNFVRSNPRTEAPTGVLGNVKVASANVLNYFTTFTDGKTADGQSGQGCTLGGSTSASNCRGANNLAEFNRQQAKIVSSLSAISADVVGLMEIQNNGNIAVQNLATALNAKMGANTYVVVPLPPEGTGSDAIRVAMLYKPSRLSMQGPSLSDPAGVNNRPPFAQGFAAANGERFAVVVNHLKSKGSCPASGSDADQGDGQGCWNATRVQQALQLRSFVGQVQAAAGTADVILVGDFNAHGQEDPLYTLTQDGAIVDQVARFELADYSYVFDGFAGRLDHGLTTASMTPKVLSATSWHVNADEPTVIDYNTEFKPTDLYTPTAYKSSDHDPMVMGLNLVKSLTGTSGRDTIVGTQGDDIIEGGPGADTLTGGAGRDQFVYSSVLDGGDTITDFTVGEDLLVFTKLLQSAGITSADPLASGHVTCSTSSAGALIGVDTDGAAGPLKSRPIVLLKGVSCAAINASSFRF